MTVEKISDSVGKKIVEALKMQNKGVVAEEVVGEEPQFNKGFSFNSEESQGEVAPTFEAKEQENEMYSQISQNMSDYIQQKEHKGMTFEQPINSQSAVDVAFTQSLNQNLSASFARTQENIDLPANVAILNGLISKLPTGVSKQTGALIIRQTMEALGISMQAVIQEAKQVQEDLSSRARECQKNILDYRKQINTLEVQSQQYQRQVLAMNDIIGLFVNSTRG